MALDHYVSQVYLRQWIDPKTSGLLHAIRKSDLKQFTPRTKDVCRIEAGNTNPYLQLPRAIEEFLAEIEPRYNWAIDTLVQRKMHREAVYVIAGLIASTMVCSPGGMRINSGPVTRMLEEVGRRLDLSGKLPRPPESLGGASFTELLDKGLINLKVDPKHPQAFGISSILEQVNAYGNFCWELLVNFYEDSPFFTSDYPVAIEHGSNSIVHRIFPLTPFVAVRICPDPNLDLSKVDFTFKKFRYRVTKLSRSKVRYINQLFVRCAEEVVFYQADLPWILEFVEKNAAFRIKPISEKIRLGEGGTLIANTFVVTDD